MTGPLFPDLRNQLAKTIQQARRTGESGARQALQSLAVDRAKAFKSMSPLERSFRNRLRARGRQARDLRDRGTGTQGIGHLAHEVAYEHWHRMLFARFLAENEVLIEPDHGVTVSLEDCRELAREVGADPWELAGRWAEGMLPDIFGRNDPVLELSLPPETRQKLEQLLESLPQAVFTAPDSLGWTYQFWQAERKDEVNSSGKKIGADELPAVTQLFTEGYMVQFLLHNTIGAWRVSKLLADSPVVAVTADDEEQLRQLARIEPGGGYDFAYLRFVRGVLEEDEDGARTGPWRPAAGSFTDWPRVASALRILDPCCGSGHFLVEAFELLVRLRMAEEGLSAAEAIRLVLRDNLFGLEIDPRCTQIAAFNLALAAWRLVGEPIDLPPLNIACTGLAPSGSQAAWIQIAERVEASSGLAMDRDLFGADPSLVRGPLQEGMAALYQLFKQGPELGSLLDPGSLGSDLFRAGFESLRELLDSAIQQERGLAGRDEKAVAAAGMARAGEILQGEYTLVVTNVPFLSRGKQGRVLRNFNETHHGDAKGDMATVFVSRIFGWLGKGGTQAVVSPQNWLFLTSYKKLRERSLKGQTWNLVARLGAKAFQTPMWDFNVMLNILSVGRPDPDWQMAGLDVSAPHGQRPIKAAEKAELLRGGGLTPVVLRQERQLRHPDARVAFVDISAALSLGDHCVSIEGLTTGDLQRFVTRFWEGGGFAGGWEPYIQNVSSTSHYGGLTDRIYWQGGRGDLSKFPTAHNFPSRFMNGRQVLGKDGLRVTQMGRLPVTTYSGEVFGKSGATVVPHDSSHLPAIWCFCSSPEYSAAVREIDQKLNVTNATLVKVPFDLEHWQKVAAKEYPNGLPEPYSDDPTQWIFHGDPCGSVRWDHETKRTTRAALRIDETVLQIAVARLLGYRWPAELESDTRLAEEQRELVEYCREFDGFADNDGIVCLAATRGESTASNRLRKLLAAAYDEEWSAATERALLAATSSKPPKSLEDWLRDRFFPEHCKLFHNRPFIWHIWDGRKDGFHALVNYHRLAGPDGEGRRTLETLTFAYLYDWIERQRAEQRDGTAGADARLAAALDLQDQLQRILAGEPPFDLFVRWRPLHRQAIGWEPDINDGVRLNIRPFMRAKLRKGGLAGAGILRWKPNIKWGKDRGKEPEEPRTRSDFPWFWSCPGGGNEVQRTDFTAPPDAVFDGNRWNDLHYTKVKKEVARQRASKRERPS